jgi:hypothetical protein
MMRNSRNNGSVFTDLMRKISNVLGENSQNTHHRNLEKDFSAEQEGLFGSKITKITKTAQK